MLRRRKPTLKRPTVTYLKDAVEILCRKQKLGSFTPIYEADIVAYLYHYLITQQKYLPSQVHVNTRVKAADKLAKYDLAVGEVEHSNNCDNNCMFVNAQAILEVKAMLEDFTYKQCHNRFSSICNTDIPKLNKFGSKKILLVELIYDEKGFLFRGGRTGNVNYLERIRNEIRRLGCSDRIKLICAQNSPEGVWNII